MNAPSLNNYLQLNRSYSPKLVFRFNCGNGFFSEYNNMVYAIIWCLENKVQFRLCSQFGFLTRDKGWQDYFLPFCPEENQLFHSRYNVRQIWKKRKPSRRFKAWLYRKLYNFDYYTSDIWNKITSNFFQQQLFNIPELHINGDINHAGKVINQLIYKFSPAAEKRIKQLIQDLHLPGQYSAIHVRSGDKIIEAPLYHPKKYMDELTKHPHSSNIFVLTDDYSCFEYLQTNYPEYKFYTSCRPDEHGYDITKLYQADKEFIYQEHLKLLASMEILKQADLIIGTLSNNPGLFLEMSEKNGPFIAIDK